MIQISGVYTLYLLRQVGYMYQIIKSLFTIHLIHYKIYSMTAKACFPTTVLSVPITVPGIWGTSLNIY